MFYVCISCISILVFLAWRSLSNESSRAAHCLYLTISIIWTACLYPTVSCQNSCCQKCVLSTNLTFPGVLGSSVVWLMPTQPSSINYCKCFLLIFQIVDLDTKRNRNREALNALKNEMSDSSEWCLKLRLIHVRMLSVWSCYCMPLINIHIV